MAIISVQIEPFGLCNAKCWFCPVKYRPPAEDASTHMSLEVFEDILRKLSDARDSGLFDQNVFLHTAHYNEFVLYRHLEGSLALMQKYGWKMLMYSNGIAISESKAAILRKYSDVVLAIVFNVPAFEPEPWGKLMGVNPALFDNVVRNINNLNADFCCNILVNGVTENLSAGEQLNADVIGSDVMYYLTAEEHSRQVDLAKQMFPQVNEVTASPKLYDRAGNLDALTNLDHPKGVPTGCGDVVSRLEDWIHINPAGKVIACCNDYSSDYVLGDLTTCTVAEFLDSEQRQAGIQRTLAELCIKCSYATYNDPGSV